MSLYDLGFRRELGDKQREEERREYTQREIEKLKSKNEGTISLYNLNNVARINQIYSKRRKNPNL